MPKFNIFISIVVSCWLLVVGYANAQATPQFLVSWRALNYAPADFQGKIFPNNSTVVEAGFDMIVNGRVVNLSGSEIRWNVNGEDVAAGQGVKTVHFVNSGTDQTVRISAEYRGSNIIHDFTIPAKDPEIVIDDRAPSKNISLGSYGFTALPYFFNINNLSELSFNWFVNGEAAAGSPEKPESLALDLTSEGLAARVSLNVSVSAQSIFNPLEIANGVVNYNVR